MKSSKHIRGKTRLASKEINSETFLICWCDMIKCILIGECLPSSVRVYRVKTVTAFLKSGVPLNKVACFRELLCLFSLSGSQHLVRELIPPILFEERKRISQLIAQKPVSLIFDGTHVAEDLIVILRFVDAEWNL